MPIKGFLLVDFAPVGNTRYVDRLAGVVDFVDGPLIADADPPFVIPTLEFFAARRAGSFRQCFQPGHNTSDRFSW